MVFIELRSFYIKSINVCSLISWNIYSWVKAYGRKFLEILFVESYIYGDDFNESKELVFACKAYSYVLDNYYGSFKAIDFSKILIYSVSYFFSFIYGDAYFDELFSLRLFNLRPEISLIS